MKKEEWQTVDTKSADGMTQPGYEFRLSSQDGCDYRIWGWRWRRVIDGVHIHLYYCCRCNRWYGQCADHDWSRRDKSAAPFPLEGGADIFRACWPYAGAEHLSPGWARRVEAFLESARMELASRGDSGGEV